MTQTSGKKIKVLFVDDERQNLVSFKATFREKFEVFIAASGPEAIELLEKNSVHIIVTDQRMPEMTGIEFLQSIMDKYPDPVRILLTGYADINAVIEAVNKGKIYYYLSKPWNEEELDMTIRNAFEVYRKKEQEKEHTETLERTNDQLEFHLRQRLLS